VAHLSRQRSPGCRCRNHHLQLDGVFVSGRVQAHMRWGDEGDRLHHRARGRGCDPEASRESRGLVSPWTAGRGDPLRHFLNPFRARPSAWGFSWRRKSVAEPRFEARCAGADSPERRLVPHRKPFEPCQSILGPEKAPKARTRLAFNEKACPIPKSFCPSREVQRRWAGITFLTMQWPRRRCARARPLTQSSTLWARTDKTRF
jgi:hypothetical protein